MSFLNDSASARNRVPKNFGVVDANSAVDDRDYLFM